MWCLLKMVNAVNSALDNQINHRRVVLDSFRFFTHMIRHPICVYGNTLTAVQANSVQWEDDNGVYTVFSTKIILPSIIAESSYFAPF